MMECAVVERKAVCGSYGRFILVLHPDGLLRRASFGSGYVSEAT